MKKKVVVIGGGIAGMAAGVYAQKCGFDVTILESHSKAGGVCTSWRRGDYLFEGGMHWLSGSGKKENVHRLWRYVGALDDSVAVHCREPFIELNHGGVPIRMYRDVNLTERHLLELAPADAKEIRRLCGYIRRVRGLSMPVPDIRGVKVTKRNRLTLTLLFSAISAYSVLKTLSKIPQNTYINRFTHEGIRELFRAFTSGRNGVIPLIFTMGSLARGDGGFPEGGSLPFNDRIINTFTKLGGAILYNTRADHVVTKNGGDSGDSCASNEVCVTGVMAGGREFPADAVIITADTLAIDYLFDTPPKGQWLDTMRAAAKPTMATFVCLGINADLKKYHYYYTFKLKTPIKLANQIYEFISINNYAADSTYSPDGKTAMTIQLAGDTYEFWKKAREENRYDEEKKKIADAVIAGISAQIPEVNGKVEVVDVATPLTYERYCAGWKGSWMTEMRPGTKMSRFPAVIKGLRGVYFAGHRMMPPGGLPVALTSAWYAVQNLCRDTGTLFISEN